MTSSSDGRRKGSITVRRVLVFQRERQQRGPHFRSARLRIALAAHMRAHTYVPTYVHSPRPETSRRVALVSRV